MNQPTAEQLEVTQADRDAAAASYFGFLASIRGEEDGISLARSFARHRQATEARMAAAVEAERELTIALASLRRIAGGAYNCTTRQMHMPMQDDAQGALDAINAIRSQSNG